MVSIRGQLDAPLLDIGAVKEDYWERKEILLPSLSRLFKPKGWRRFFYKQQAPKIVLKRLTQSDWDKIDDKSQLLNSELGEQAQKYTPIIQKYSSGKKLTPEEYEAINEWGIKMRPVTYMMLQQIIEEPEMSYDEVNIMMEVLDDFDKDTLLSYVSLMTSEKASVMKRIYEKRMKEAEIIKV
jgi:hypothetical protein